jgi:phytoene/squalene synthetase
LQLANFWQDVDRDLEKGRIYIPLDLLRENALTADDVVARRFDERFVKVMKELIVRTRALFSQGAPLARQVSAEIRIDIELFTKGGLAVLDGIEAAGYDTLHHRPAIGRATQIRLLGGAILERCMSWLWPADSNGASSPQNRSSQNGPSQNTSQNSPPQNTTGIAGPHA